MSEQRVIAELQQLGLSGYEAKAYVALVVAGVPANGYEVAKRSGVPRSTVYETLGKLVGRGIVYEVRTEDDGVGYVPLPPAPLLERMRCDFDRTLSVLEQEMPELTAPVRERLVHSLGEPQMLLARAEDVVAGAAEEICISGWAQDIDVLRPALRRAIRRGVEVNTVVFGPEPEPVGWVTEHRYPAPDVAETDLGQRLLVVVGDRAEAVIGGVAGERTRGLYTDDPATVLLAGGFVCLDTAMQMVADRFADAGFDEYWHSESGPSRLLGGRPRMRSVGRDERTG